jgi:RNA polymerase sigma factor (sigma-70 family)
MPAAGPLPGPFPLTRRSLLLEVASEDPKIRHRAFDDLVAGYWPAVYKYLRLKLGLGVEDAEDLTQGFFAKALEKGFLERFDPQKARFRTYLRTCLDRYAANEYKAARRQKRGGGAHLLPLDFQTAEGELEERPLKDEAGDPEDLFHREWVRTLFTLAVEDLRRHCEEAGKEVHFRIFERYDLEGDASYKDLAADFDLPVTQITNHLAFARRTLRANVLERLRVTTGSDAEFQAEARDVLGVEAP